MKKYILLLAVLSLISSFPAGAADRQDSVTVTTAELADRIIEEAEKYIGVPYRAGGKGPKSFDCSGFTRYVYARFGFELSPSSSAQAAQGREVQGPYSNLQKGDILVFGMRSNRRKVGHVGIYIGPDETGQNFTFIHAGRKGIRIAKSNEEYWTYRFLGARRLLPDFIADTDGSADGIDSTYTAFRDTLTLGEGDYRVVLLSDGTWAYVLEDGTVQRPSELKEKIVMDINGRWAFLPISTHIIPLLSSPAPQQITTVAPAAAQDGDDGEAIYHTIKQGDTLSALAHRYHTSVNAICRLNGITQGTVLRLGRRLRVK